MHRPFKGLKLDEKKNSETTHYGALGPAIEGWGEGVNFGLPNFHDSSLVGGPLVLSWNYPLLWTGFYILCGF